MEPVTLGRPALAARTPAGRDKFPIRNGQPSAQRAPQCLSLVEFDRHLNPHSRGWSGAGSKRLVARVAHVAPGPFDPSSLVGDAAGWRGLLVIEGLALAQISAGRAPVGWLVGADDLIRPWEMKEVTLLAGAAWQALSPLRIALLDGDFARRASGLDTIDEALVAKASQTSNWLFAKSLVTGTSVIEERLLLLFALLGERWGKATPAGVVVAMPLTHQVLATLVGARRPSVSTALTALSAAGFLQRIDEGWLLCRTEPNGRPPRPRCWPQYAEALGLALSEAL